MLLQFRPNLIKQETEIEKEEKSRWLLSSLMTVYTSILPYLYKENLRIRPRMANGEAGASCLISLTLGILKTYSV